MSQILALYNSNLLSSLKWNASCSHTLPEEAKLLSYSLSNKGVAVIDVRGVLAYQHDAFTLWLSQSFGLPLPVTYHALASTIELLNAHSGASKIVLAIDSPGGAVAGIEEAINAIRASKKVIVTQVANMCCSAAYWLASQTSAITATSRLATFGSMGVVVEVVDYSEREKSLGINSFTITNAQSHKKRVAPTDDGFTDATLEQVNTIFDVMASDIALGRKMSVGQLLERHKEGAVFFSEEAKERGFVDQLIEMKKLNNEIQGDLIMTEQEFKGSHGELYEAITAKARVEGSAEGFTQGKAHEQLRVSALSAYKGVSAKIDELVADAIVQGKEVSDILPSIMKAQVSQTEANLPSTPPVSKNPQALGGLSHKEDFAALAQQLGV